MKQATLNLPASLQHMLLSKTIRAGSGTEAPNQFIKALMPT